MKRAVAPVACPVAGSNSSRTLGEAPVTVTMIAVVLIGVALLGTLIAGARRRWRERRSIDEYSVAMSRLRDLALRYGVDEGSGPPAPRSEPSASESPKARAPFTDARTPEMARQHPSIARQGVFEGAEMGQPIVESMDPPHLSPTPGSTYPESVDFPHVVLPPYPMIDQGPSISSGHRHADALESLRRLQSATVPEASPSRLVEEVSRVVRAYEDDATRESGVEANARLTATTGLLLVALFFCEGVTIPVIGRFLTWHVSDRPRVDPPSASQGGLDPLAVRALLLGRPPLRASRTSPSDAPGVRSAGDDLDGGGDWVGGGALACRTTRSPAPAGPPTQLRRVVPRGHGPSTFTSLASYAPRGSRRPRSAKPTRGSAERPYSTPGRGNEPCGRGTGWLGEHHGDNWLVPCNRVSPSRLGWRPPWSDDRHAAHPILLALLDREGPSPVNPGRTMKCQSTKRQSTDLPINLGTGR